MEKPHHHLLLSALLIISTILTAESQTSPGDTAAMQALSTSLGADTALKWSSTSDPCKWDLVTCSEGRVTAIQIGNHSLHGTLPSELGNLTSLVRLELQANQISGPLPSLSGLANLQILLLHGNHFSSIPQDFFSGLSALQSVSLDNNPFVPWSIPVSLKDATTLVNFSANSANITGGVPDFFASFPSLDHLGLAYNLLGGGIPPSFAGSSIRSLWLNNQQSGNRLSGGIDVVQNMTSLVELWLHSNSFSGPLPDFSGLTNLQDLQLRDNRLTGTVPLSLISLKSLKTVTLTNNLLQGPVPVFPNTVKVVDVDPAGERFCLLKAGDCDSRVNVLLSIAKSFNYASSFAENWKGNDPCTGWMGISCDGSGNITVVNFQKMGLNGTISPDFSLIGSLQRLLLSNNNLTGTIPSALVNLTSLKELDISNNLIWGTVPNFNKNVLVNTAGNPNIGKDSGGPSGAGAPSGGSDSNGSVDGGSGNRKSSSVSAGVIVGSLIAGLCGVCLIGLLLFCFCKRKKQSFARVQSPNTMVIHPRHSGTDPDILKITIAGSNMNDGVGNLNEMHNHTSSGPSNVHVVDTEIGTISIQVLRNVTNNFSEENVLGRGGFGTVYKGELHDGTKIAVKRMESGVMGETGLKEFESEIAVLTKVRHRHLVSLLGYCLDGNERLLVFEYMPQGTLSHHLFNWKESGLKPLEWKKRLSIGLDVARGVEYLHSLAYHSFIHRDLKPSNILLGDDMKAKVADFGLVRRAAEGKVSVETRLAGTFGYLAPEYAITGRVTTKVDVYSFGVILMELITGRKALDESQPEESMHLVTWFRRLQISKGDLRKAIDPIIDLDDETLVSIRTVAELAGHCCTREPYQRPDMGHAVNVLSSLAEIWKPTDQNLEDNYGIDLDLTLPQALKKWQAIEDSSLSDGATSSFLPSLDNTQSSIPCRPVGFAESFASADGR